MIEKSLSFWFPESLRFSAHTPEPCLLFPAASPFSLVFSFGPRPTTFLRLYLVLARVAREASGRGGLVVFSGVGILERNKNGR